MPAGLNPALLKAIECLNKELDWPNKPRTVNLQMLQTAFPARLIKPQAAPRKKTRRLVLQPDRAEQALFALGRTPPSKGS